jgi:hypothetical protein
MKRKFVKHLTYIVIVFACVISCQSDKEKIVEGDLYFKLFDFERYFDAPESSLVHIENAVKSMGGDTLTKQDLAFKYLVEHNLLRKPFIRIRLYNGDNKILLLDSADYSQFVQYKWSDLVRNKEKVRIKVAVREFDYPHFLIDETERAYDGLKVLSVDKVEGETYWKK